MVFFAAIVAGAVAFYLSFGHYLKFSALKQYKTDIQNFIDEQFLYAGLLFSATMTVVIGLNIPGATMMALTGGLMFPQPWSFLFVFTGYTLGACSRLCKVTVTVPPEGAASFAVDQPNTDTSGAPRLAIEDGVSLGSLTVGAW